MHGLVVSREFRCGAVMHDFPGLHDIDLIGDGQSTVQVLLDQQNPEPRLS